MQNVDGLAAVLGILSIVCVAAPILLAVSQSRRLLIALSILLTGCAAVLLTVGKGFGDTVLVASVWIGAMICGVAAYLDRSITRNARNSAFRLLENDNGGLTKPEPSE
jgi:hypothetical protein